MRRTPIVLLRIATVGLLSTFAINFGVSVPPMVKDVLTPTRPATASSWRRPASAA